ncbi:MAG: sugar ABC transporter permease [Spirochaetes bacterium]|nr:sugar ABC transporter permease [Spirochaetota bacterium]
MKKPILKKIKINYYSIVPWVFLSIPLTMYLLWVIIPVFQSFLFAFTKTDSIVTNPIYIGFKNFIRFFSEKQSMIALKNNLFWLLLFVFIPIPLGLLIAMYFNTPFKGTKIFKTLFYLPMTLSFAIIGTIWMWIYNPNFGVLNTILRSIGLNSLAKEWLGDERYMTGALIVVGIWRQVPYVMILYLAGLKNVPSELIEASMVDGANWFQRFKYILIPTLTPATIVAITISIIDSLRTFDIVYVMTNTKARAAETLATYMYTNSFGYSNFGFGSAISVIQFLITLLFILIYINNTLKSEEK